MKQDLAAVDVRKEIAADEDEKGRTEGEDQSRDDGDDDPPGQEHGEQRGMAAAQGADARSRVRNVLGSGRASFSVHLLRRHDARL